MQDDLGYLLIVSWQRYLLLKKYVEFIGFESVFEDIRIMPTVHNEDEIIHQVAFSIYV